jgi:hypothetical protein
VQKGSWLLLALLHPTIILAQQTSSGKWYRFQETLWGLVFGGLVCLFVFVFVFCLSLLLLTKRREGKKISFLKDNFLYELPIVKNYSDHNTVFYIGLKEQSHVCI